MLLYLVIGIVLLQLVFWNNKRNKRKLYDRKSRRFRDNYQEKKREKYNKNE